MTLIFYLGTRRVAALLAEVAPGATSIVRSAEIQNAEGFQRGTVVQLEKAHATVEALVKELELGDEVFELPAYVLLSGPHLKMSRFSSAIYYSGYPRVVTPQEIRSVIDQTRSVAPLPLEDWILQAVPESFWVNDLTGVQDPLGLEAQRLAVSLQIFTTQFAAFRNVSRLFENLGFNVQGYLPKTLVLPAGVLNASEREGETLLLDVSDEATHLILTREGRPIRAKSLDLGGRFLTNRIAETWQLGLRDAERLKERFGSLEENLQFGEELVPLVERDGADHQIRRSEFHTAFFKFGEELFASIEKEVKELLSEEKIAHPRFVLTGGGGKLEGLIDFLSKRLSAPVRLGNPRPVQAKAELVTDPAWAGAVGLLHWLGKGGNEAAPVFTRENAFIRTLVQAKDWLAAYF
jgi:cell division protein FtsA